MIKVIVVKQKIKLSFIEICFHFFVIKTMFSKSCEYAIRAAIFIATQAPNNANIGIKEIAKEIDSPIAFTAKILQVLVKNNILKYSKGVV